MTINYHTLYDWQDGTDDKLDVEISFNSDAIHISEPDAEERAGRHVWVELENGVLRVHCYDGAHEEPFNVDIYEREIESTGYDN